MRMMRKCICWSALRVAAEDNTWSLLSKRLRFVPKISGETEPLLIGGMPLVMTGPGCAVPGFPMGLPREGALFNFLCCCPDIYQDTPNNLTIYFYGLG